MLLGGQDRTTYAAAVRDRASHPDLVTDVSRLAAGEYHPRTP